MLQTIDGSRACRVVKVGGSLLDLAGLWRILTAWLDAQSALDNLLIVGGGALAEQVRQLDERFGLAQDNAHWLAIRAMDLNGFVLSRLVPGAIWSADYSDRIGHASAAGRARQFVAVESFLRREEPVLPGVRLPCGWHVTSDSIAARLAAVCQARELVLLKSTSLAPHGSSVTTAQAAAQRLVDDFFPTSASPLTDIRAVNLRDSEFAEVRLTA
jgi:5-(aminomethyl)-3-furanmethanol phosphate kinase